jgi:hypothetical protein
MKKPADFIGMYIGHSEEKTGAILAATVGKVLIIDEAYGLSSSGSGVDNSGGECPFRKGVQDTLVAEIQAVPGDDRCVNLPQLEDILIKKMKAQNITASEPAINRQYPFIEART